MPALLPWLALAALVFGFRRRGRGHGAALVEALVWWSALLALGSEVLSMGHALTRSGVVVYWLVLAAVTGLWARRARAEDPGARASGSGSQPERALAFGVAAILALVLLTTLLMPANAQDVMTYHLPRVLHWAQGASLEPFPTHDSRQLYHPPFAELVDLHFLLLSGGDRWVGPLRVLFLAGAGIAAAEVARRLAPEGWRAVGVGAAAVAVSAPLTLGSVHGGKNDPVAGFFLLAMALALLAACERLRENPPPAESQPDASWQGAAPTRIGGGILGGAATPPRRVRLSSQAARDSFSASVHQGWAAALEAGLALGLALLTKATTFLFAPPFVALLGLLLILRHRFRAWPQLLALVGLPVLLMAGHMARNLSVYGHPLADPNRVEGFSVEGKGPASALSNVLRFSSEHFGGPWESWNRSLERGVRKAHGWFGLDADDPRTTTPSGPYVVWNALRLDLYAGSPAHFLLALIALGLVVSRRALRRERTRVLYALALAGAALFMCASLRWFDTVTRLQSPLFLLAAPLVAVALAGRGAWVTSLYAILLVAAVPWIVCTIDRGWIGPGATLYMPRRERLFYLTDPELRRPAEEAAAWIGAQGHHSVGVQPDTSVYAEYPLWLTLEDRVPGLRLEHVNARGAAATPASWQEYRDFLPDVVLRITAFDPKRRQPLEPSLMVGKQAYALRFQNERLGVYEQVEHRQGLETEAMSAPEK